MGRGGAAYLSYAALVLLSSTTASAANSTSLCAFCNLWKVSVDLSPAPSPEDGPPFSAHATRNKAVLPYEIIGIVGAYIASVLILGLLLLTVGRSLRRQAHIMADRPVEMVRPMVKQFEATPISPKSERSWYARHLRNKRSATSSIRSGGGSINVGSPGMDSVVSFDPSVVEADRSRRQDEMERLYAAVMAHDDRKQQPGMAVTSDMPPAQPPHYDQKRPPRLVTDAPHLRHLQPPEKSPGTPKSPVRAIYPPDLKVPQGPQSPISPVRADYPTAPHSPTGGNDLRQNNRKSRASSFGSQRTAVAPETEQSGSKRLRKSLRNLKISAPIVTDDNSDGARTPLSPRFYTDPGVPPEPPTGRSTHAPTTPASARSYGYEGARNDYPYEHDQEELDQVRDLPHPHPNRIAQYNYANEAQAVTDAASLRPDPTGTGSHQQTRNHPNLTITPATNPTSARPLPFRQLDSHQQAAYAQAHPLSPLTQHFQYPASAGPGQTQFVSPRRDKFGAPRTGVATPYSPYMPFTPLTPVTPRLTSRAERKQRQREERQVRGAITEEDVVADEKELWSSGY